MDADTFWARVQRGAPDECWPWTGALNYKGYGMTRDSSRDGHEKASHRALLLDGRPRPDGAIALHSCDNPPCCNPAHLRWGTVAENQREMSDRDRVRFGDAAYNAKLRATDIPSIRSRLSAGHAMRAIARDFGVSKTAIRQVATGRTWRRA